jgi:hypothetical protein
MSRIESSSESPRAFIGVVSRSHVARGVAGGFAQLCHGKHAPLARMRPGDFLVYYSPRTDLDAGEPLRAFTAMGRVTGEASYRFDMGDGFVPHRREIAYFRAREVLLDTITRELHFTQTPWGLAARRGHFEIDAHDLDVIARAMEVPNATLGRAPAPVLGSPPESLGAPIPGLR